MASQSGLDETSAPLPDVINGVTMSAEWRKGSMTYSARRHGCFLVAAGLFLAMFVDAGVKSGFDLRVDIIVIPLTLVSLLGGIWVWGWVQWRRFGDLACDLVTNPGVVGGVFRVRLRTRYALKPNDVVLATLSNIYHAGKHTRTVWQQNVSMSSKDIQHEQDGECLIPVAFYIPVDCHETTATVGRRPRYGWKLKVQFEVPGMDMHAVFAVPVFHTEASQDNPPAEAADIIEKTGALVWKMDEEAVGKTRVRVFERPLGEVETVCPPNRESMKQGLGIILLVVAVIMGFAWVAGGNRSALIVLGALSPVFFLMCIAWFHVRRTVFAGQEVKASFCLPLYTRTRTIGLSKISGVGYTDNSVLAMLETDERPKPQQPKSGDGIRIEWAKPARPRLTIAPSVTKGEARLVHHQIRDLLRGRVKDLGYLSEDALNF